MELLIQWSQPLSDRISKGDAIAGLSVDEIQNDYLIRLVCQRNNSRFREGDFLVLHKGHPTDNKSVQIVLEEDDEFQLMVRLARDRGDIYLLESETSGWIADESSLDLTDFYLDTLDEIADTTIGREIVLPMITGNRDPCVDYDLYQVAYDLGKSWRLNESQAEALGYAYGTDLSYLIQGPPGTGKTYVLAYLAKLFVDDGLSVFVTALTHRAINNALEKIYDLDPSLPVCKIGRSERAKGLHVVNYEYFYGSGFDELDKGYIVGATPFATRASRLGGVEFDVVIFDEASQVTLPLALMGMLAAKKYIFIGDEHQLPPVTTTKSYELAKYSIFKYLSGRGFDTMLTTTYRLNRELASWPNRTFYDGRIQPSREAANRKFPVLIHHSRWEEVMSPEHSVIFIDLGHRKTTVVSNEEADIICSIISLLINADFPPEEIGVVVPYRMQARMIRNGLRQILGSQKYWKGLVVDTVERMQGQEREIVLVSLATSSSAFASQVGAFFFQPQRLNVAVTRPRTKLIIIGSSHLLNATHDDPEISEWIVMFNDLISSCKHISFS